MGVRSGLPTPAEERLIAGRYRVESQLGQGGMGAVYAAVDVTSGRRVAVKTTQPTASPKALELFKREFHTLHGLRHPNIIEVYDYGIDAGSAYYTMELLEGGDLGSAAPLPWREVCGYLRQVATLLGLLHARRLLHRDVTPRNLWRLPDGRLKLIDFGALCAFGTPTEVVGTPPFIAPEWFAERGSGVTVDQRADLFALGALAYWLLTSAHAYPARSLADLPRVWAREPAAPSSLAQLITNRALEPIPPELDAVVVSLLRKDPAARPETTEVVIDRIDAIAGPVDEPVDHAVRGYVRSKAFVGRRAERDWVERKLRGGLGGSGAIAVEALPGMGRTRLLEELSVIARLQGATSLFARGDDPERAYGLASAIALALFEQLPSEAAVAARPHAAQLAQLSPEVQRRLGVPGRVEREATPAGRARLQTALADWVFALAKLRQLVLLVDDLERSDEESAAFLAALATGAADRRLLIVGALAKHPQERSALHLQLFREAAHALPLAPLTAAEVHDLLHSVFGPAAYLARVSDALHRASRGNPAHCLELVDHLVERGLARYSEGTWTLPGQLPADALPTSRREMHVARLERSSTDARGLAELLSIHDGRLSRGNCRALSELNERDTDAALVELTLDGVLSESEAGYAFVHAGVREALAASVTLERRVPAHARLAASLAAEAVDPIDGLRAGLHFHHAGDVRRCERLVRAAAAHLFEGHRARMQIAVPLLERALQLYRDSGRDANVQAVPLAALAAASYFVDRRLADRYGHDAIEALEEVLRFDLARKLKPYLGAKAALFAALAAAGVRARSRRDDGVGIADVMRMLAGSVIALNAVATSSFDLRLVERCQKALEPFAPLGDRNIAGFIRRCTLSVASILSEHHAAALAELRALAELMDSGARIEKLPDHLRREFLGGCLFSIGVMETWRQSSTALAIADRIEDWSPLFALSADHLRAVYYSGQGDTARAERVRQRLETRALQVGAAWQVVTLGPIDAHITALWTHDAQLAKRSAAELERLSRELPALRTEAERARGTYLVLCGRYREAIDTLGRVTARPGFAGWVREQAMLARAHNRLGEHARARELCRAALARLSEADLGFVVMTLHAQLELVLAEAALGNVAAARAQIAAIQARYADSAGPLARGAIHDVRARIALLEGDFETCDAELARLRRCYEPTGLASLLELTEQLEQRRLRAEARDATPDARAAGLLGDDAHLFTRMQLILTNTEATFERRAERGLQIAFELTGASRGFVIARDRTRAIHAGDEEPSPELVAWAKGQLASSAIDQTALATPDCTLEDSATKLVGSIHYCVLPLPAMGASDDPAAAIVLGFEGIAPRTPGHEVLSVLANHLLTTRF